MKILIVDDCSTMIALLRSMLKELGTYQVDVASNGKKALRLLQEQHYGIVFTDWNMPELSGIELLKIIRASEKIMDQIVIMITVEATKENIMLAEEYVIDGYLAKPLNINTLQKTIMKVTKNKNQTRDELIGLCHHRLRERLNNRIAKHH